jgi:hypothetical protein
MSPAEQNPSFGRGINPRIQMKRGAARGGPFLMYKMQNFFMCRSASAAIPNLKIIAVNMKKRIEKRVFYHTDPS